MGNFISSDSLTKDSDFIDMSILYGQPPKIIWLKIGNQTKAATTIINSLLQNREEIEKALILELKFPNYFRHDV